VGIDIIDWPYLRRLGQLPLDTAALMVLVLFLTVFVDLITAVLVGVFLSNMITVERLTTIQLDNVHFKSGEVTGPDPDPVDEWLAAQQGRVALLSLAGPLSFGVGRGLRRRLAGHVSHEIIIVDLTGAQLVGTSTAMILDELIRNEQHHQRYVLLVGISEQTSADLKRLGALQFLDDRHRFASLRDAMDYIDRDGLH